MGDRSNVYIQQYEREDGSWTGIGIYCHWAGAELFKVVRETLGGEVIQRRIGDPEYFARILVHRVLDDLMSPDDDTGGGLWTRGVPDNEHPVLVVSAMTGRSWWADETTYDLAERGGPA